MPLVSKFERLNHDAMHRWTSGGTCGMGEVADYIPFWPSERERDPCAPSPAWCNWMPGSDYVVECQPIDPVACQQRDFGPALTPANRDIDVQAGDQSVEAYCRTNPAMCAAYEDYEKRKACIDSGRSPFLCDYGTQLFWGSVAVIGGLILMRR